MLFLRYYLWITPHFLLAPYLVIAWRRGWHRRLPVFFCFGIFEISQFLVLFSLNEAVSLHILPNSSAVQFYEWMLACGLALTSVLKLVVLFYLGRELLQSRKRLAASLRPLMKWTLALLVLVAVAVCASFATLSPQRAVGTSEVVDFSSNLIQAGLLLVLFIFSRTLYVSWRRWPTGVALGFGVSACISLASAALRATFGKSIFMAMDIAQMAAFHICVLIWLIYLFLPDRPLAYTGKGLSESDILFWDQELQRMTWP